MKLAVFGAGVLWETLRSMVSEVDSSFVYGCATLCTWGVHGGWGVVYQGLGLSMPGVSARLCCLDLCRGTGGMCR